MTDSSDDETIRDILRSAGSRARTGAVSDAAIAAWAEGRLDPERAALVEAHLATDDETRAYAFALRDEVLEAGRSNGSAPVPSLAAARARRSRWFPFATAAVILLAAGAALYAQSRGSILTTTPDIDSDARLVASATDLAKQAPSFFADFQPVAASERRAAVADTSRSGLSILEPIGHVLFERPELRWSSSGGASSYEIAIADADGAVLWRKTTQRTSVAPDDAPRLERGRSYVIEINATGPLGRTTASRPFDVADADTSNFVLDAHTTARKVLGDDLGDLAWAHGLARRGFLTNAKGAVTAYLVRRPNDAAAREFDEYLRRRLGWPEGAGSR